VIAGPSTVTVLVGAPASGKTTLRARLVADGLAAVVLSLDDERAALRDEDLAAGRPARPLQGYSHRAVQRCAARAQALLAEGRGYLMDATNLRRRERVSQLRAAQAAGLRRRAHRVERIARAFLGVRERKAHATFNNRRKNLRLLRFATAALNEERADHALHVGLEDKRLAERLHHAHEIHGAAAEAAMLGGNRKAGEAHLGKLRPRLAAPAFAGEDALSRLEVVALAEIAADRVG
jgi:predicted kinase